MFLQQFSHLSVYLNPGKRASELPHCLFTIAGNSWDFKFDDPDDRVVENQEAIVIALVEFLNEEGLVDCFDIIHCGFQFSSVGDVQGCEMPARAFGRFHNYGETDGCGGFEGFF